MTTMFVAIARHRSENDAEDAIAYALVGCGKTAEDAKSRLLARLDEYDQNPDEYQIAVVVDE